MRIRVLASVIASFLIVSAACAGDIPIKLSPSRADLWSSFYIGGNLGGGLLTSDHIPMPTNTDSFTRTETGSQLGVIGGIQAGYDIQVRSTVFGIVADANLANITTKTDGNASVPLTLGAEARTNIGSYYTIRGRVGYLLDPNSLVYGTAGVAFVNVKTGFDYGGGFFCDPDPFETDYSACDKNKFTTGFAVGAGYEAKLTDRLSLDVGYLYIGLPTRFQPTDTPEVEYGDYSMNFKPSIQAVKIGLNWHFN